MAKISVPRAPARRRSDASPDEGVRLLPRHALVKTNPLDQGDWNYRPVLGAIQRRRFDMLVELLPARTGTILEVGYGSGVFMPELSRRCDRLLGADVHEADAEVADALASCGVTAELTSAPIEALPYGDATVDVVVVVSALEFVDDLDLALDEVCRVMRPGGTFAAVTPGHHPVLDLGLRVMTGERAEDTFQGRRQAVLPALRRRFSPAVERRTPSVGPLWLYTAFAGSHGVA